MKAFRLFLPALLIMAAPAHAHPGHRTDAGFMMGLLHPLSGADHLLAMLMVGLWSGLAFPRHWWVCPAAFLLFMAGGFLFGAAGGPLPIAEMLILASLIGLGLALVSAVRLPLTIASGMIGLFAIGHGFAHGQEMGSGGHALRFAAGFLLSTALLHGAGLGLARWVRDKDLFHAKRRWPA